MSYESVEAAVPESVNIVSDPPRVLDMELAPAAGRSAGASADEVARQAEADGAPFAKSEELKEWVRQGLAELA